MTEYKYKCPKCGAIGDGILYDTECIACSICHREIGYSGIGDHIIEVGDVENS